MVFSNAAIPKFLIAFVFFFFKKNAVGCIESFFGCLDVGWQEWFAICGSKLFTNRGTWNNGLQHIDCCKLRGAS